MAVGGGEQSKFMKIIKKLKQMFNGSAVSGYDQKPDMDEAYKQRQIALLTPREQELFLLLLEGYTLKESAQKLSIKYSTANTHMTSIYKKLGVNSRAELIINYRKMDGTNHEDL